MNYNTIIIIIICSSKHQCMNTINCARQETKKTTELANASQHSTAVSRLSHTLRARRVFVSISLYSIAFLHFINRYQVNAVCVLAAVCSRNQPGTTTTTTMCGPQLRSRWGSLGHICHDRLLIVFSLFEFGLLEKACGSLRRCLSRRIYIHFLSSSSSSPSFVSHASLQLFAFECF